MDKLNECRLKHRISWMNEDWSDQEDEWMIVKLTDELTEWKL